MNRLRLRWYVADRSARPKYNQDREKDKMIPELKRKGILAGLILMCVLCSINGADFVTGAAAEGEKEVPKRGLVRKNSRVRQHR